MFTMNKFWERFFYAFTYLTQGSSYLSPRAYAILHRMHHAYSDTEKDPHSPHHHHNNNVFSMMWRTKEIYNDILEQRVDPEIRFEGRYPVWNIIERIGDSMMSRIGWGTLYVVTYILMVPTDMWYLFMLLPVHFLMGPVHGAIVNWCGHMYGYQNYNNNDKSRNTLVFDLLMMGELFQNNHHSRSKRANFASQWWEIDPTYPIIKLLSFLRIIRLKPYTEAEF
jgi:stearoyl-CoA desaturase (delta-9 desaturase)